MPDVAANDGSRHQTGRRPKAWRAWFGWLGTSHRYWFLHDSLRRRILLLALAGLILSVAILGALGVWAVGESIDRTLQERLTLARAIAGHVDYVLTDGLETLHIAAQSDGLDFSDSNLEPEQRALASAYQRRGFTSVSFVDLAGRVVWTEPSSPGRPGADLSGLMHIQAGLALGTQSVTNIYELGDGTVAVSAVVPVRSKSGELMGLVVGDLDLPDARLQQIIKPSGLGPSARVDVIDGHGVVLASTNDSFLFHESDHQHQMEALIQARRSTVGTCHSCHEPAPSLPEAEVMALAPMSSASWAVVVREAERDALAPAGALQVRIVVVMLPLLIIAVAVALFIGRGMARSVERLAESAERITAGDLVTPVPVAGPEEVGQLGQTLDVMRERLRTALEHERDLNLDLERRVEERTKQVARSESALRQRNAELSVLNEEIRRKEVDLAELLRRIIAAQEDERRRIARDMHDETSQTLAAVLVAIETAEVSPGTPEAKLQLGAARKLSERALRDIHKLIFDLRPSLLDDLGLVAALRWYAETRLEAVGIKVYFEVDGEERRLAPEIETSIFRIVQEGIANIAKHARAENAAVRLEFGETSVMVEIEDDGRGFDPAAMEGPDRTGGGFGLLGMRERASLIGGSVELQSRPDLGTTVRVRVPLAPGRVVPANARSAVARGETS